MEMIYIDIFLYLQINILECVIFTSIFSHQLTSFLGQVAVNHRFESLRARGDYLHVV